MSGPERHRPRASLLEERREGLLRTSLPALLRYEDRNSMAFSLEARTPFLDYRLVERALGLPSSDLVRGGWTKAILRDGMAGLLPDDVRLRRDKVGFIFQVYNLLPTLTVAENITLPIDIAGRKPDAGWVETIV